MPTQATQSEVSGLDPAPTGLVVGRLHLATSVLLAPMSGVSDLPFRRTVAALGSGTVVSEMVASEQLVRGRADVRRRAEGRDLSPFVMQLVGHDPRWMGEAARIAEQDGADIIDINMGCPAREVTGKLSGSALMRDPDHAARIIDAVVASVAVPVTLKMRLGWDASTLNAPELARRAEARGVAMLTVHGRTRCQFFKGTADWAAVRCVKEAVAIPVVVNGDITSPDEARRALALSGADGVMIGRGAYGAPWILRRVAVAHAEGADPGSPTLAEQRAIAGAHIQSMLSFYGLSLGLRNARKHIGWYLAASGADETTVRHWRRRLCQDDDAGRVLGGLGDFYSSREQAVEQAA